MDITKILEIVIVILFALLIGAAVSYKRIWAIWLLLNTPQSHTNALPNEGVIKVIGKGEKMPFVLSLGRESDLVKFLVIRMVPIFIVLLLIGGSIIFGLLF